MRVVAACMVLKVGKVDSNPNSLAKKLDADLNLNSGGLLGEKILLQGIHQPQHPFF